LLVAGVPVVAGVAGLAPVSVGPALLPVFVCFELLEDLMDVGSEGEPAPALFSEGGPVGVEAEVGVAVADVGVSVDDDVVAEVVFGESVDVEEVDAALVAASLPLVSAFEATVVEFSPPLLSVPSSFAALSALL
jgi:hypothetical protein